MKCSGDYFIIHCIFLDDMKHVPTSQSLLDEFVDKYSRDFEITCGKHLMEALSG